MKCFTNSDRMWGLHSYQEAQFYYCLNDTVRNAVKEVLYYWNKLLLCYSHQNDGPISILFLTSSFCGQYQLCHVAAGGESYCV